MFGKQDAAMGKPVRSGGNTTFSVIGSDVTITGDVEASVDLHVDGSVRGDLSCASLVQGEGSTIEGGITAESARLSGTVKGSIKARELMILKSAHIMGDVEYTALTIEQGARVEGHFAQAGSERIAAPRLAANEATGETRPALSFAD